MGEESRTMEIPSPGDLDDERRNLRHWERKQIPKALRIGASLVVACRLKPLLWLE